MGQTSGCGRICKCNDDNIVTATKTPEGLDVILRNKARPLLCDLEADFEKYAGPDGKIGAAELAEIWQKVARLKVGSLSDEDAITIRESAATYIKVMDLDANGRIDHSEFVTFMLGGLDSRGPFQKMRDYIRHSVAQDPASLQNALEMFKQWDLDGDGYVTRQELLQHVGQFAAGQSGGGQAGNAAGSELAKSAAALLDGTDIDSDGKIDLWEFLAYSLGRRKVAVELLLYDISHGVSKRFSPILLGRSFEAIYHSGTIVHGTEFWYGGRLFQNDPPMEAIFGPPLSSSDKAKLEPSTYKKGLYSVHIGYTLATMDEILSYLGGTLRKKYTPDNYDVLTHNCNCFSDDFVHFLTGSGIPDAVKNLPELVMKTPTARLLRPLLNKWLGGFQGGADGTEHLAPGQGPQPVQELGFDDVCRQVACAGGDIVCIDPATLDGRPPSGENLLAQVLKSEKSLVDLKFFDPGSCTFVTRTKVPQKLVMAVPSHEEVPVESMAAIAALHAASDLQEEHKELRDELIDHHAKACRTPPGTTPTNTGRAGGTPGKAAPKKK